MNRGSQNNKKYGVTIVTAIKRLTIRELVEQFDMGYGTLLGKQSENLQMLKIILSYIFYLYFTHTHVASYSIHRESF